MKIINKPQIAITTEELIKLRALKARNPICDIIKCDNCSCDDCPFDELTNRLGSLLSEAVETAETLPIYKEGE